MQQPAHLLRIAGLAHLLLHAAALPAWPAALLRQVVAAALLLQLAAAGRRAAGLAACSCTAALAAGSRRLGCSLRLLQRPPLRLAHLLHALLLAARCGTSGCRLLLLLGGLLRLGRLLRLGGGAARRGLASRWRRRWRRSCLRTSVLHHAWRVVCRRRKLAAKVSGRRGAHWGERQRAAARGRGAHRRGLGGRALCGQGGSAAWGGCPLCV